MSNAIVKSADVEQSSAIIQVIERAASNPAVDIEKMERLLAMQERILDRNARSAYAAALARMQPELPIIEEKGRTQQSKYARWEDVVGIITPILARHGFALSFRTKSEGSLVTVTAVLSHEQGHSEATSLTLPFDTSGNKNAVQSVGSSTSYGKRYTASAILNLRTGDPDDDGQSGAGGAKITDAQVKTLEKLIEETGANQAAFLKHVGSSALAEIPVARYSAAVAALNKKRAQR